MPFYSGIDIVLCRHTFPQKCALINHNEHKRALQADDYLIMLSLIPEPQKILTPDAPLDVVVIVVSEFDRNVVHSQVDV